MSSTSPAQARLMAAVAHGWHKPGGGGPPVAVAKEFNQADKDSTTLSKAMSKGSGPKVAHYAEGGPVLGRSRSFMKEPDRFRESKAVHDTEDDFEKGSSEKRNAAPAARGKQLPTVRPRS